MIKQIKNLLKICYQCFTTIFSHHLQKQTNPNNTYLKLPENKILDYFRKDKLLVLADGQLLCGNKTKALGHSFAVKLFVPLVLALGLHHSDERMLEHSLSLQSLQSHSVIPDKCFVFLFLFLLSFFFFSLKKSFVYIVLVCLVFRQQKLKITFQFKHSSIVCVSYYRCVNASLPVCKMLSIRWLAWWIGGDFIGLNWVLTLSPAPS